MTAEMRIYLRGEMQFSHLVSGPVKIGRQRKSEPEPIHFDPNSGRLVVAQANDQTVSREHLEIVPHGNGETQRGVVVINRSSKRSLIINSETRLPALTKATFETPLLIAFADYAIRLDPQNAGLGSLHLLEYPTLPPQLSQLNLNTEAAQPSILKSLANYQLDNQQVLRWLDAIVSVLQNAAGSDNFLDQAARAVQHIVDLDSVSALILTESGWQSVATINRPGALPVDSDSQTPSRSILDHLLEKRRTLYQIPEEHVAANSLQTVKALVAAPILDPSGMVTGAIYGTRTKTSQRSSPVISAAEALLVEVLACTAATGIAREDHQRRALEIKTQFEQFFSKELAEELRQNPRLLDPHDADITVLFCDIVGFTTISQQIGPKMTMQWVNCVMGRLSDAVLASEGVIVDYIGDELMAMWGAPRAQRRHSELACEAALAMMRCRDGLDRDWMTKIGSKTDFRIGIASGPATVGNAGSERRLKYSPLGTTVNLASRLQSAGKQIGAKILIDAKTAAEARCSEKVDIQTRSLGTANFVNLSEATRIFELLDATTTESQKLISDFNKAIESLEAGDLENARLTLTALRQSSLEDLPTLNLLSLLSNCAEAPNPTWVFTTK